MATRQQVMEKMLQANEKMKNEKTQFQEKRAQLIEMARTRIAKLKRADGSPALHLPNFETEVIALLDVLFYLSVEHPELIAQGEANEKI